MTNNAEPIQPKKAITYCHLPILFEFYNLHAIFLPLFRHLSAAVSQAQEIFLHLVRDQLIIC